MDAVDLIVGMSRTFGLVALITAGFGWAISATERGISRGVAIGVLFSIGGIMSMSDPIVLMPGVIVDGRTVVISLAYSFSGVVGTLIVSASLLAYRLWIGGAGALSGSVGIVISAIAAGLFWHFSGRLAKRPVLRNVLLALSGSTSLASLVLLPADLALHIASQAALPVIAGNVIGAVVLSLFLVREKQRLALLRTLQYDAAVDPLTKLVNRRVFDRIAQSTERRAVEGQEGFAVALFDIDNFKRVNDTLGHQAGDEILRQVAATIRNVMRGTAVVARYGGEEIVVLMPKVSLEVAEASAEGARAQVERDLTVAGEGRVAITVSAGVASFSAHARTLTDVLREADKALYRAKRDGRNCVRADRRDGGVAVAA